MAIKPSMAALKRRNTPRRLFIDIETSPNVVYSWRVGRKISINSENIIKERAIICIGFKWQGGSVQCLTWKRGDDKAMLQQFIPILESADEVVCVTPDTRVLTADLRYVPAGDLVEGDKLVGFTENIHGRRQRRRFQKSIVEASTAVVRPCLAITLSDGSKIKCSREHPFLVPRAHTGSNWEWVEAQHLKIDDVLTRIMPVFTQNHSYKAAYLAGLYDGEGSICGKVRERKSGHIGTVRVSCAQVGGGVLDRAIAACKSIGYDVTVQAEERPKPRQTIYRWNLCGKQNAVKFLGEVRPERLIQNLDIDLMGALNVPLQGRTHIVSIVDIGPTKVQQISTSTRTLITEGFPSHNCHWGDRFDMPWLRARAAYHNILVSPYIKTIDTCAQSKRLFYFNTPKLDYLGQLLGLGKKIKTDFDLWKRVVAGEEQALEKMSRYCARDVRLLEKLYLRLEAYNKPKTHQGVVRGGIKSDCPQCASKDTINIGKKVTGAGTVKARMRCKRCGSDFLITPLDLARKQGRKRRRGDR